MNGAIGGMDSRYVASFERIGRWLMMERQLLCFLWSTPCDYLSCDFADLRRRIIYRPTWTLSCSNSTSTTKRKS